MRWSEPNHFQRCWVCRNTVPSQESPLACPHPQLVLLHQMHSTHPLPPFTQVYAANCMSCTATGKHPMTAFATQEFCSPTTKPGRQVPGFLPTVLLVRWLLLCVLLSLKYYRDFRRPQARPPSNSWCNSKAVLKQDRFSSSDYQVLARKMCWTTIWNNL